MYDAIVLAGGGARRLGGVAKPQLRVGGRSLLDRVVDAVTAARQVVVVGPEQPVGRAVHFCREQPAGGGPVAAVAAGLPFTSAATLVILAADLPWIAPAVTVLRAARPPDGVALLVDADGRRNNLAAAWQRDALVAALAVLGDPVGAAMRTLVEHAGSVVTVPDPDGWGRDCDTWDDVSAARAYREED